MVVPLDLSQPELTGVQEGKLRCIKRCAGFLRGRKSVMWAQQGKAVWRLYYYKVAPRNWCSCVEVTREIK